MYDNVLENAIPGGIVTFINTYTFSCPSENNTHSYNVQAIMTWFAYVPLDWNRVQRGAVGATCSVLQGPPTGGPQALLPVQRGNAAGRVVRLCPG